MIHPPSSTPVRIVSTGKALPSRQVSSTELDAQLGQRPGHVQSKSGVRSRFFAADHETQSELGAAALRDALVHAQLGIDDIDLILGACGVSEQALPNTAAFIASAVGLPAGTPAFDINASCLSFLVALKVAADFLSTSTYRRIAIVSADLASRGVNWSDPESSYIFGDGAAAVIVESGHADQRIKAYKLATYSDGNRYCEVRAGGSKRNPRTGVEPADYLFRMDGKAVMRMALQHMPGFMGDLMQQAGCSLSDIDWVIPHQASGLSLAHAAKRLNVPDSKIIKIFEDHGNQVAASLPTALHEAIRSGRAQPGHQLLLMGTAAGLSLGGLVLTL